MKKLLFCITLLPTLNCAMSWPDLNRKLFTEIYSRNLWGSAESRSGDGSTIYRTTEIRRILPELITRLHITTMVDVGCGDFNWMRTIDFSNIERYTGLDIVDDAIYHDIIKYQDSRRSFQCIDVTREPIPRADLIIERDCMMHLSNDDFKRFINNIKKTGSQYLLATTFARTEENSNFSEDDIFRSTRILRRNLQKDPFNFPEPIAIFDEGYEEKSIALWRIDDLPFFDV